MGTKNAPNPNDCYAKAEPDEPMFVLLARDPLAPYLVRKWADGAMGLGTAGGEKGLEARECADAMDEWRRKNRPEREVFVAEIEPLLDRYTIDRLARSTMTPEEAEAQRRSFTFGNVGMSNPAVTREMVDRAAEGMQTEHTAPQPTPKQDDGAPALWPLIVDETEKQAEAYAKLNAGNEASVRHLLVADMRARHEFGLAKYGVPLVAHNDRDHLSDAYQETLDGVVYLRAEIEKRGGMKRDANRALVRLYMAQFKIAFDIRAMLRERDGR